MQDRVAVIDIKTNIVATVAVISDGDEWSAPAGYISYPVDETVATGDAWDPETCTFTPAPRIERTVTLGQLVDVGLQLNVITPEQVATIVPGLDLAPLATSDEGANVLPIEAQDALVNEAASAGTIDFDQQVQTQAMDVPSTPEH